MHRLRDWVILHWGRCSPRIMLCRALGKHSRPNQFELFGDMYCWILLSCGLDCAHAMPCGRVRRRVWPRHKRLFRAVHSGALRRVIGCHCRHVRWAVQCWVRVRRGVN
jgi:hypothetical protein